MDMEKFQKELVAEQSIIKQEENMIEKEEKIIEKEQKQFFHALPQLKRRYQALFAVFIVTGVVLVWRGIWNLVDKYWFPAYTDFSDIFGICVGLIVLYWTNKLVKQLAE
jgi:hypothetical protein